MSELLNCTYMELSACFPDNDNFSKLQYQILGYFVLSLATDMEWITGHGSNEVDIGYVPLMRVSSLPSLPWEPDFSSSSHHQEKFNYSSIVWDQEIPMSRARQEIEGLMYPFKKVFETCYTILTLHLLYSLIGEVFLIFGCCISCTS